MSRWTEEEICRRCGTGAEHHTGPGLECPANANPMGLVGMPIQWPPPRVTHYDSLPAVYAVALDHSRRVGQRVHVRSLRRPDYPTDPFAEPGWLITPTDRPAPTTC